MHKEGKINKNQKIKFILTIERGRMSVSTSDVVIDELSNRLKSAEIDEKLFIIERLKSIDNPKRVDILINLLKAEGSVVWEAINVLGEIKDCRAIIPISNVMQIASERKFDMVLLHAATALGRFGSPAIKPLIEFMKEGDYDHIYFGLAGLGEMTSEGSGGMGEKTCSEQTLTDIKQGFVELLNEVKDDYEIVNYIVFGLSYKPYLQEAFHEALISVKGKSREKLFMDLASRLEKQNILLEKGKIIQRCFKTGHKCSKSINEKSKHIFVGMPFDNKYKDVYQHGILPTVSDLGFTVWKADEIVSNIDIMCKIFEAIQESPYAIINISELNANVMFELGLLYGLSKKVLLINNKSGETPVDLSGLEYRSYTKAEDVIEPIKKFFEIEMERQEKKKRTDF